MVPLFVWQPISTYAYDPAFHPQASSDLGRHEHSRHGYPLVHEVAEAANGPQLAWCDEIQRGVREPLYVDAVHYGPKLSRLVADCIAAALARRLPGVAS